MTARPRGVVLIGSAIAALLGLLLLGALALAGAAAWYWNELPALDKATDYRPQQHLQVFTADGVEIAQFGSERRFFVPLSEMPKLLPAAVLAVEDADFYAHGAISWRGVARAALAMAGGGRTQGASTITQQVARTFFLSTQRTAERKIKEALLALQLERRLSKDQILELYLNQIYLGQRAYGFGAAARVYFGKPLAELSTAETALLAGLPQNPIHANPVASLERAKKRQEWVLNRMQTTGVIDANEAIRAQAEVLQLRSPSAVDVPARFVAEMARRAVVERLGDKAYTGGMRVFTSLRADEQRAAHAALRRAVLAHARKQPWRGPEEQNRLPDDPAEAARAAALAMQDQRDDEDLRLAIVMAASPRELTLLMASGPTVVLKSDALKSVQAALSPKTDETLSLRRGSVVRLVAQARDRQGNAWALAQWPQEEAAFVAMDPVSGRVRALVGGFDFDRGQFNHVTTAQRQPGSSFKPFLYSAALEHGVMPQSLVDDAPLSSDEGGPTGWNPKNSDGRFDGEITLREGLVRSKNLVSVRLLKQVGLQPARDWMARFGFDMARQPQNLTLALGSGSVTPLELAQAYAVFANGGYKVTPVLIEKIFGADGQMVFEAPPALPLTEDIRVVPARNVFIVNTLLADVTRRGTAARAQAALKRPDLYGKTGTTNDAVDAWFAGWAPGRVAVAWMGYDEPRSLGEGESGGGLALPIWTEAMAGYLKDLPVRPLPVPEGVVEIDGDWRFEEWAKGGFVERVGKVEPTRPTAWLPVPAALPQPSR